MVKCLLLWEVDQTRVPISPQERGAGWDALIDMVKADLKKGILKDWGGFVGENNGYAVVEGSEVEIGKFIQQYVPWVVFKTHAVASVSEVDKVVKSLIK